MKFFGRRSRIERLHTRQLAHEMEVSLLFYPIYSLLPSENAISQTFYVSVAWHGCNENKRVEWTHNNPAQDRVQYSRFSFFFYLFFFCCLRRVTEVSKPNDSGSGDGAGTISCIIPFWDRQRQQVENLFLSLPVSLIARWRITMRRENLQTLALNYSQQNLSMVPSVCLVVCTCDAICKK